MLRTLIKKQFFESFRGYFVNQKTGKARSKGGIAGMFILFAFIMATLCITFYGLASLLGPVLKAGSFSWLFFTIMGSMATVLGTFGSVFNTFASLYLSKDNDMLLSMPIAPSKILASRISLVFGLSMLYSGAVWLPAIVYSFINAAQTVLSVAYCILLWIVISAFVTVLTCILGWLVAYITSKFRKNSFFTVFLTLLFIGGYYFVYFKMSEIMKSLTENAEVIGNGIKTWANLLYHMGKGAAGNTASFLIFLGITAVSVALCIFVLSKSFIKIVTSKPAEAGASKEARVEKQKSITSALIHRELKRFISSPLYMMNTGLGVIIGPAVGVVMIVKKGSINGFFAGLESVFPGFSTLAPVIALTITALVFSLNLVSTPSISLEGKTLWVLRSMPVDGKSVMEAKMKFHLLINAAPAVLTSALLSYAFGTDISSGIIGAVCAVLFVWLVDDFGLILGIKNPNFNWTNETVPIKQSLNVLIAMFGGWVASMVVIAAAYLTRKLIEPNEYLIVCLVVFTLAVRIMNTWIQKSGGKLFDELNG